MNSHIMRHYKKRPRLCYASQLPKQNDRLDSVVERVSTPYFDARIMVAIGEEVLTGEVVEHGKRLRMHGKAVDVAIRTKDLWNIVEALRKAAGGGRAIEGTAPSSAYRQRTRRATIAPIDFNRHS